MLVEWFKSCSLKKALSAIPRGTKMLCSSVRHFICILLNRFLCIAVDMFPVLFNLLVRTFCIRNQYTKISAVNQ